MDHSRVKFNFQVAPHEVGQINVAATVVGGQMMYIRRTVLRWSDASKHRSVRCAHVHLVAASDERTPLFSCHRASPVDTTSRPQA